MLAQRGYIVASVDNRGTPRPRGRAWRKSHLSPDRLLASQEQAAAARASPDRAVRRLDAHGVWGWSGGGSMTLNLMFRSPDVYQYGHGGRAGAATMRFYDTIYQERYMGLPQTNADGYRPGRRSLSPTDLRGNLLARPRLRRRQRALPEQRERSSTRSSPPNKPFTMMDYPNRTHGICEGQGTTVHLYELLTRYLGEHLK